MVTVGVRDLKNQLSLYLQYVKDGEKVVVTEHNRVIAEISVPESREKIVSFEEKLLGLSKQGEVLLAKADVRRLKLPAIDEKLNWESLYDDMRGERL